MQLDTVFIDSEDRKFRVMRNLPMPLQTTPLHPDGTYEGRQVWRDTRDRWYLTEEGTNGYELYRF